MTRDAASEWTRRHQQLIDSACVWHEQIQEAHRQGRHERELLYQEHRSAVVRKILAHLVTRPAGAISPRLPAWLKR